MMSAIHMAAIATERAACSGTRKIMRTEAAGTVREEVRL